MERVLLVAEPSPQQRLEAAILRRYGFEVRTAWPPDAALHACASDAPDLVLAPAGARTAGGQALTAGIREVAGRRDVGVLCLAADLGQYDEETEHGEPDTVLLGPVRAQTLVHELAFLREQRDRRFERPIRRARARGRKPARRPR